MTTALRISNKDISFFIFVILFSLFPAGNAHDVTSDGICPLVLPVSHGVSPKKENQKPL